MEGIRGNPSTGEVSHSHGLKRGKFLGYWVQIIKFSGEKHVFTYDQEKIDQWKAKAQTQNVWKAWPEEMAEQACIRHACSRFEEAKDALAEAYDNVSRDEPAESVSQSDDISDRAGQVMPDIPEESLSDDETEEIQGTVIEDEEDRDFIIMQCV
jgi:recombinational DNA repair protein RecT